MGFGAKRKRRQAVQDKNGEPKDPDQTKVGEPTDGATASRRNYGNTPLDMKDKVQNDPPRGWVNAKRTNDMFVKYYREIGICKTEEEFQEFLDILQKMLPITFRITGFVDEAEVLRAQMESEYLEGITNIQVDGKAVERPFPIPWYPKNLAYQVNLDKVTMRRCSQLRRFHEFLVAENSCGGLTRQEMVSMLPPLVLAVESHHKVLDMCAAPGSKTTQLIEMIHENSAMPTGYVVANDVDNKRCYLMTHQIKRLNSPCCLVINEDASHFPYLMQPGGTDHPRVSLFDRVLCDVPCSGDGTVRKNYDIWTKWSQMNAFHLHKIQKNILKRGLDQLAPGGRLVYSTCSLNPVENEAVLAAVLNECAGCVSLSPIAGYTGLRSHPGLTSWPIMSKQGDFYTRFEDVPKEYTSICDSIFPPSNIAELNMDRAIRIMPHYNNSGGFFVALIEKTALFPWQANRKFTNYMTGEQLKVAEEKETKATEVREFWVSEEAKAETEKQEVAASGESASPTEPPAKKFRQKGRVFNEDPFIYVEQDHKIILQLKNFFGLEGFDTTQLIVRHEGGTITGNILMSSSQVRDLILANRKSMKLIHVGVRAFAKSESTNTICPFRIAREAANVVQHHTARIVPVVVADILKLLTQENVTMEDLSPPCLNRAAVLTQGSVIFRYSGADKPACTLLVPGWVGVKSCRAYVPNELRSHLLRLCGVHEESRKDKQFKEYKSITTTVADEKPESKPDSDGDTVAN